MGLVSDKSLLERQYLVPALRPCSVPGVTIFWGCSKLHRSPGFSLTTLSTHGLCLLRLAAAHLSWSTARLCHQPPHVTAPPCELPWLTGGSEALGRDS